VLRHSRRKRPLKASMQASVAFPVREMSSVTPLVEANRSRSGEYEFRTLVCPDRLRIADLRADPFQCLDHVLGPIAEPWTEHGHMSREKASTIRESTAARVCRLSWGKRSRSAPHAPAARR